MNKEKIRKECAPNGRIKRTSNFDQRRKGFNPNRNFENNSQNYSKNNYQGRYFKSNTQQNFRAANNIDIANNHGKNNEQREPVKCWES